MERRAPTARDIQAARDRIALQFQHERMRLGLAVVSALPNYKYIVRDGSREYTAIILPTSFDFYEFRLNVGKQRVDMLIVSRHNAVVPVAVVSLADVTLYEPLASPILPERDQSKKNTQEDARLLLSKLILEFESAKEELAGMTDRSRRRYEARKREYLKKRIGRPWAS